MDDCDRLPTAFLVNSGTLPASLFEEATRRLVLAPVTLSTFRSRDSIAPGIFVPGPKPLIPNPRRLLALSLVPVDLLGPAAGMGSLLAASSCKADTEPFSTFETPGAERFCATSGPRTSDFRCLRAIQIRVDVMASKMILKAAPSTGIRSGLATEPMPTMFCRSLRKESANQRMGA